MFKLCIKFIFYPMLIVIVGMYYLVSYLTVGIATLIAMFSFIKSNKEQNHIC